VLPPAVYSHLVLPGQAIAVAVGVYIAVRDAALGAAGRHRRAGAAGRHAGGAGDPGAGPAADRLPRPDRKFAPLGFALFLLSPAVVIARRMSAALNAEERSRTLEENARLREDVERISRHDLKTPLNSILGRPACCTTTAASRPTSRSWWGSCSGPACACWRW
jgi:signal transduction histidine kinase